METVAYANERVQFDKPLGAFQALAHYMADASTSIDGGRALVHEAAWNRTQGRSIARLAPMAKLFCCEAYRETTRVCAQIWGGVAFTIEYDQQMFFRRAKHLQLSWWDTPYLEELVAADVLDS
jgi:alkylation response protein AidB-like acyl-CoA dehydrogenase